MSIIEAMVQVSGYHNLQQIYVGTRTLVYRGVSCDGQKPVVLKLMRNDYPSFNELVQFRNQFTIAKNLDLPGIVKPLSLENYRSCRRDNGTTGPNTARFCPFRASQTTVFQGFQPT